MFLKDPSPTRSDVYYYRSGSAAARMDAEFARNVVSRQPRWMHVTGVTPALSRTCAEALGATLSCAREVGVPVSFDVNYRRTLWADVKQAAATIREAANQADVVFVGLDEAHALWGTELAEEVRALLPSPSCVVVKDGALEAKAFSGAGVTVVPALAVDVVEPVGAGDAFAAGWLHAHLSGMDAGACLRLGHLMAGVALGATGDIGDRSRDLRDLIPRAVTGQDWPGPAPSTPKPVGAPAPMIATDN